MSRTSQRDQLLGAIRVRLHELDHRNAKSPEEAAANEQTICNAFGMMPSEKGTYDYCPVHPESVRYHGQCSQCSE